MCPKSKAERLASALLLLVDEYEQSTNGKLGVCPSGSVLAAVNRRQRTKTNEEMNVKLIIVIACDSENSCFYIYSV